MGLAWLDRKHARRGWIGLLIAAIAVVAAAIIDDNEKVSMGGGYQPLEDAEWYFASDDLPGCWSALESSAVFSRISTDAPELYPRVEGWLRQRTGLRWTPARWRLWFGSWLVVSGKEAETVACVQPGLLFRASLVLGRWTGQVHQEGSRLHANGMYAEWNGVDLVAGTSPEIVDSFLQNLQPAVLSAPPAKQVSIGIRGSRHFDATIDFQNEIAATLKVPANPVNSSGRAEHFAIEWPEPPLASVSLRDFSIQDSILPDTWPAFPGSREIEQAWNDFEAFLPEGWRAGADTTQFALFDVDTSETIPLADAAVYSRSETPLAPLMAPPSAIPYEWSGNAGWMTPWLGEGAQLFVVANERSRVFANQEATMAKVMARERAGRITSDDARIDVDAARLAAVLSEIARKAAREELWPERNEADVERDTIPWLNAFGALGDIAFVGKYEGEGITLRGGTHAPAKAAEAPR